MIRNGLPQHQATSSRDDRSPENESQTIVLQFPEFIRGLNQRHIHKQGQECGGYSKTSEEY